MKRTIRTAAWLLICALLGACDQAGRRIAIEDAWSPAAPPGAAVAAVYMRITARESDVLLSASTPIAARTEMHATSIEDGMMQMRPLAQIELPADEEVRFEPGGRHFMLVELASHPPAGASFPMTLTFRNAGALQVEVLVRAPGER